MSVSTVGQLNTADEHYTSCPHHIHVTLLTFTNAKLQTRCATICRSLSKFGEMNALLMNVAIHPTK